MNGRTVVSDGGAVQVVVDRRHGVLVLNCGSHNVSEIVPTHEVTLGSRLLSFCDRHEDCRCPAVTGDGADTA